MAKGASKSVVEMLECREGVGEYRRAGRGHRGGARSGTGDPGEATPSTSLTGLVESPVPGRPARRVREAARGNPPVEIPAGRPESTSHCSRGLNRRGPVRRCRPNLLVASIAGPTPIRQRGLPASRTPGKPLRTHPSCRRSARRNLAVCRCVGRDGDRPGLRGLQERGQEHGYGLA